MDDLQACTMHPRLIYCPTCRSGEGRSAKLVQCPGNHCGDAFYCPGDLEWCMGPPANTAQRSLETPSSFTRTHSPKPIPCDHCMEPLSELDYVPPLHCSNSECWSKMAMMCDDCLYGGISCSNCSTWICEECEASSDQDIIWECRECHQPYCYNCHDMDVCVGCGLAGLCHECSADGEGGISSGSDDDNMSYVGTKVNKAFYDILFEQH
jgi:hypothetical protein